MSESFADAMRCAKDVMADCDMPLLDRLQAAHDREMHNPSYAVMREGISEDARKLELMREYDRGFKDGKRVAESNPATYDELGNERHKAVCELRKMSLGTGSAVKKLAIALGVKWNADNAERSVTLLQERLIDLLGGDQPTLSDLYGIWKDGTDGKPNGTCPDDAPTSSITDELREYASARVPYPYSQTVLELADRIDEQFDRCCRMWEQSAIDTAREVHDSMEAECNRLVEERDRLRQAAERDADVMESLNLQLEETTNDRDGLQERCENQRKRLGELERACNTWYFEGGHQLSPMEAYKKIRRAQINADKAYEQVSEANSRIRELIVERDGLQAKLDAIKEAVNG